MSGYTRPRLAASLGLPRLSTARVEERQPSVSGGKGLMSVWRRLHRNGKPQLLLLPVRRHK